jgi:ribosomal protein S18 acetylase RimI-like enzyme
MHYREATPDDIDAIRAIATASWEADYPAIISRETIEQGIDEWYAPEALERELDDDQTILLLAVDEAPCGFVHAVAAEGTGHLLRLYVEPDRRREGLGGRLLDEATERLLAHDIDRLRAMVLSANDAGIDFYRTKGFDVVENAETTIGSKTYAETTLERPIRTPVDAS